MKSTKQKRDEVIARLNIAPVKDGREARRAKSGAPALPLADIATARRAEAVRLGKIK